MIKKKISLKNKTGKRYLSEELAGCLKKLGPLSDAKIKRMYVKDKLKS